MTWRLQSLPSVPEATVTAVQAAFPKGNLYVELRAEFGPLYNDQLCADLSPPAGRPVEVAPWRLALVVVMQYVARVPPALRAPRRKTPRGNSPSGCNPTTRRFRPPDNDRKPPSSKPSMPCGPGSRPASRKASGALTCARVGTLGWHARTSSSCSMPPR
jgi:hypothetical protein